MNIIITGVAGMIGSRLADWIIKNNPEISIIGIDDLSGGYIENINQQVKFIKADLTEDISSIFQETKPDIVWHLGAYAAEGLSPFIRTYNYKNNLIATSRIVNECIRHSVKRLVFTSSMAVYGNGENNQRPFDETHKPLPIDPYGVAKFASEMDIQIAGEQHNLDWCIIRPHNVYGIKQNIWDKYRNVLGIWMYKHLNNMPMPIFGDGEQKRAFSYVDDCMKPLYEAGFNLKASKQIINLGGSIFYSINEANKILKEIMGGGDTIHLEGRHEIKNAFPTWQKSTDILGYKDITSLKDGLTEMWDWAKKQPIRKQRIWNKFELDNGVYKFWKIKENVKE